MISGLVVLDIDNTLLHTIILEGLNEHRGQAIEKRILELYPNAKVIHEPFWGVAVPRPGLSSFIDFLTCKKDNFSFGVYSTASTKYLESVLPLVDSRILNNAQFVYSDTDCSEEQYCKDLNKVARNVGLPISKIIAIDDLEVVKPVDRRIPIKPFRVESLLDTMVDSELEEMQSVIVSYFKNLS